MFVKLFDDRNAPNARRVRLFLREKDIDIPLEQVNLAKHEHRLDGYRSINPLMQLPALLLVDGTVLTESIAICRYIEELHPEPNLFGAPGRERAIVEMWQRRLELYFLMRVIAVFRHEHPAMKAFEAPQILAWAESSRAQLAAFLEFLNQDLNGRPFMAGNAMSVADITGFVAMDLMKKLKIFPGAEFANLDRWHREIASRPDFSST